MNTALQRLRSPAVIKLLEKLVVALEKQQEELQGLAGAMSSLRSQVPPSRDAESRHSIQ
jgi:hypothetical protein